MFLKRDEGVKKKRTERLYRGTPSMHKQTTLANRIEVEIKVWVKKQESTRHAEMEREAKLLSFTNSFSQSYQT